MPTSLAASSYLANAHLNHVFRQSAYAQPTGLYVALFDTTSSDAFLDAGTLTGELSTNGYARVDATSTGFSTPSTASSISNDATITFPAATGGAWPDVYRAAIMDASTAGNVLFYGTLETVISVAENSTFKFNVGQITILMTAASDASTFVANSLINHTMRIAAYPQPASLHIPLFDSTSSDAGLKAGSLTGELLGNNYSRFDVSNEFGTPSSTGSISNTVLMSYDPATADWNQIIRSAMLDESNNVLFYGALTSAVDVNNGSTFKFDIANWTATLS